MALIFLAGLAVTALGVWMQISVQKRNFERRNAAGMLEFENFGQSYRYELTNRLLKAGGWIIMVIGVAMVFIAGGKMFF